MKQYISKVKGLRGDYANSSQNSAHKPSQTHLSLKLYEVLFHYLMNLFHLNVGAMDF